jgi:hypothetical protein
VDEFAADLRAAGFSDIVFHDETQRVLPSARRILLRGLAALPFARAARAAGLLTEVQLAHVRSSVKQYAIWQRSAMHGIFSARK